MKFSGIAFDDDVDSLADRSKSERSGGQNWLSEVAALG
jgi:hypothetical protein